MSDVVLNWKRARVILYTIYALLFLSLASLAFIQRDATILIVLPASFGVLFYYVHSRLKRAEAERLSIPKNSSASDVYSLFANVLGGLGKFFSVVMASTFVAIITVVLSSAL